MHDSPAPLAPEVCRQRIDALLAHLGQVVLGKEHALKLALTCLLADGHLLIEDLPGVGKTTLAHALASALGLSFRRIQFTSDMLPADILGVSIYEGADKGFRFHPGPVFTEVLLADEINRAPPKVQGALLEAMEERQVSIEGQRHPLPSPFFVLATQNPVHQLGTYPLPESQLDRFTMTLSLGYPDPAAERAILEGQGGRTRLEQLKPCLTPGELAGLQAAATRVHAAPRLLDYLQALVAASRQGGRYVLGLSPRAALGLLATARAWALVAGRAHVEPDDVQAVLPAVAGHRLTLRESGENGPTAVARLIEAVPVP
ncbi:MAG: MoxR family ATPase [Halothiobacillaceae bacterium]|nr:MoxR family ATPase [Halothiobacillaceae bacterium]